MPNQNGKRVCAVYSKVYEMEQRITSKGIPQKRTKNKWVRTKRRNNNKSILTVTPCIVVAAADVVELNVWERGAKPYPGLGTCRSALTTEPSRVWCYDGWSLVYVVVVVVSVYTGACECKCVWQQTCSIGKHTVRVRRNSKRYEATTQWSSRRTSRVRWIVSSIVFEGSQHHEAQPEMFMESQVAALQSER